jgi:hypothetical protein
MRWKLRSRERDRVDLLTEEMQHLREENTRLRLAAHQPQRLDEVTRRLRAAVPPPVDPSADEGDAHWQVLADGIAVRETVISALHEMQVAAAHLERRLRSGLAAPAIDRRAGGCRRAGTSSSASPGERSVARQGEERPALHSVLSAAI